MTMAEMLITIAIIIILMAVAFIAVSYYQRSMAQKERDAIAKEIFISAQNHLTMSRGVGYLGATDNENNAQGSQTDNNKEIAVGYTDSGEEGDANYFIVSGGDAYTDDNSSVIDYMLPFGAIEETVRTGDSYIIRYQPETAEILDVFYCTLHDSPAKFNHTLTQDEYATVKGYAGDEHKSQRRKYTEGSVLGWYGGEDLQNLGNIFKAPLLDIKNGNKLVATISDPNENAEIKIIMTGVTSGAKKGIKIKTGTAITDDRLSVDTDTSGSDNVSASDIASGITTASAGSTKYTYVLDDITTAGQHFSDLGEDTASSDPQKDKRFIAGEDIKLEAVAYSSRALANIAYSDPVIDNSLYESISKDEDSITGIDEKTAFIANIRHLENLEEEISNTGHTSDIVDKTATKKLTFTAAKQTRDIDLDVFASEAGNKIYTQGAGSATDNYYPVSYDSPIDYDGLRHSISNIETNFANNAGLFGLTTEGSVKNLELIDFDIASLSGDGNAGALAGSTSGTDVSNIIAYNTLSYDNSTWSATSLDETIKGTGSAGGLVGAMSGGSMDHSGAALVVEGSSNAGGLIGSVSGSDSLINACFSGGHTQDGRYFFRRNDRPIYNVISSANAGGLIGSAGSASIDNCYSTCSASGGDSVTGGLVGTASGSISNCYATGLVSGDNALIGSGGASFVTSLYYEIINEESADETGVTYKEPGASTGVDAIDDSENSYQSFVGGDGKWIYAGQNGNSYIIYDDDVDDYYSHRFNLRTVTQLEAASALTDTKSRIADSSNPNDAGWYFVNHHYGDWPAPELFFINN